MSTDNLYGTISTGHDITPEWGQSVEDALGSFPHYLIFKEGSTYKARDESGLHVRAGATYYSSSSLATLLQYVHDNGIDNTGALIGLRLAGTLAAKVSWQKPTLFIGSGVGTTDTEDMYQGITRITFGNRTAFEIRNKAIQFRDMVLHGPGKTSSSGKAFHIYADTSLLTANAASGQKEVAVTDGTKFLVGQRIGIKDDNASEGNEVDSINGNTLTMVNDLANTYTTAANGTAYLDINQGVRFENVIVTDTYYPFYMSGDNVWNITFNHIRINNCYDAIHSACTVKTNLTAYDIQAFLIDHDFAYLTKVDAIFLENCHGFAPANDGIHIASFYNGAQVLRSCQLDNCGRYALYIPFSSLKELFLDTTDCWFKSDGGVSAVLLQYVSKASIKGGRMWLDGGASHDGVCRLENCEHINIVGVQEIRNASTSYTDKPFELDTCTYCAIIGNTVRSQHATGPDYLIKETGTSTHNVIVGNIGRGAVTNAGGEIVGYRSAGDSVAAHNYGGQEGI